MEKEKLFSLVALVCIIFFYSIPSSKRSVYLMPAYPFIAIFLAQYTLYITEYRTKVTRVFAAFMASITAVVMIAVALTMAGAIDPVKIASQYTSHQSTLEMVELVSNMFAYPCGLTICILIVLWLFWRLSIIRCSRRSTSRSCMPRLHWPLPLTY